MKKKSIAQIEFREKALFSIYRLKMVNITCTKYAETIKDILCHKIPGVKNITLNFVENDPHLIICSSTCVDIIMDELQKIGVLIELKTPTSNLRIFYY